MDLMFRLTILACLLISFVYVIFSRRSSFSETFEEIKSIFIMPYGSRRLPNDVNSVVINQGNPALGLPLEFFVDNPKLTIKELHEIAKEILPQDSSHNFVVTK